MILIEETEVPQAAIPLDAFKAHLRLGTGFSDGDVQEPVLESFLRAAVSAIEARTGKVLIERGFTWKISQWRDPEGQPLPLAPVTAITALRLRRMDDSFELVDPARYRLEEHTHRPVLRPVGAMLPAIPTGGGAEIDLTAGMGADWGALPADLGQAVLLLAAHYYEYRHEMALHGGCMPFGVTSLIERYRPLRLHMGGAR